MTDLAKIVALTINGKPENEVQTFDECFKLVGSTRSEQEKDVGYCLLARMVEKASPNTIRSVQSRLANRFAQISDKFTVPGSLFVREVLIRNSKTGDLHGSTVNKIINNTIDVAVLSNDVSIRALAAELFGLRVSSTSIATLLNTLKSLLSLEKIKSSSGQKDVLEIETFGISSHRASLTTLLFECLAWAMSQVKISGISIHRESVIGVIEQGIRKNETRHFAFLCLKSLCENCKFSISPMIGRIVSTLIVELENADVDLIETLSFICSIFGPINSTLYKHFYVIYTALKQPLHLQPYSREAANLFAQIIEGAGVLIKPEIFVTVQRAVCESSIRNVDVDLYHLLLSSFMALNNEYVPAPLQVSRIVCSRTRSRSDRTIHLRNLCDVAARPRTTDIANIKAKKTISLKEQNVIETPIEEKKEVDQEMPEKEVYEYEEEEEVEEIQILEPVVEETPKRKSEPEAPVSQPKKKKKVVVKEVNLLDGEASVDDIMNFFDPS